jgi:cytochrome b561
LHWIIASGVFSQYVISILMPISVRTPSPDADRFAFSFGVVILVVMVIRFVYRLLEPVPAGYAGCAG